jgi:quinol monooxygenase YgiN
MAKFAFRVELKAKPGKEAEIEAFLKHGAVLAEAEAGVVTWHAFKQEDKPGVYGIFDTFDEETGRDTHAKGELAKALFAKADEFFSEPPTIHSLQIISNK